MSIGHDTVIGEHAWFNVNDYERAEPSLVVGNFCFFGRRTFLNAGRRLEIGDYCMTGPDVHFLGSDHGIHDPLRPYLANAVTIDGTVKIGANCWFGSSVIVLNNLEIGHGCVVGAGAIVARSLPPFSLAVGNPARVIKRFDFTTSSWRPEVELSAEALDRMPAEDEYLEMLRKNVPYLKIPAIAASRTLGHL